MIDYPLVYVKWVDSYGVSSAWKDLGNVGDEKHIVHSVGWLVGDGKNVKAIVPHLSPENDFIGASEQGCGDMAIPVSAILEMKKIMEGQMKPKKWKKEEEV